MTENVNTTSTTLTGGAPGAQNTASTTTEEPAKDYIDIIKNLKETTIAKAEYEKLKAENGKLLQAFVNGEKIDSTEPKKPTADELRKALYKPDSNMSNLETIAKTLELREAIMEEGAPDPMGEEGEAVATALQEAVEYSHGDLGLFNAELRRKFPR